MAALTGAERTLDAALSERKDLRRRLDELRDEVSDLEKVTLGSASILRTRNSPVGTPRPPNTEPALTHRCCVEERTDHPASTWNFASHVDRIGRIVATGSTSVLRIARRATPPPVLPVRPVVVGKGEVVVRGVLLGRSKSFVVHGGTFRGQRRGGSTGKSRVVRTVVQLSSDAAWGRGRSGDGVLNDLGRRWRERACAQSR